MKKKYYEAYEERYKKIHKENLTWFSKEITPELLEWIDYYHIPKKESICEIGCGEGRDSVGLAKLGYPITGIDISKEAIDYCQNYAEEEQLDIEFICQNALDLGDMNKKFKYLYSIATFHMLVDDNDRQAFLLTLSQLLEVGGKCLLINLGDGVYNYKTDSNEAFELQKRTHFLTKQEIMVAATSFRCVDFDTHIYEINKAGFTIEKQLLTSNPEYTSCMTMYLAKR